MEGIIDIGSNSVRLLYDGKKTVITTRLAENMQNGVLDERSMERTTEAIKTLYRMAGGNCRAFATEAVRKAANKFLFLEGIRQAVGLEVRVLSGDEEAEVSFLGATAGFDGKAAVIDLGGASCEIIIGGKTREFEHSFPFGCVTMHDRFGDDEARITAHVLGLLELPKAKFEKCFAVGGTVTSLAAMSLGLAAYDPTKVHGYELSRAKISDAVNGLRRGVKYPTLSPERQKTIISGAAALCAVMQKMDLGSLTVSESDNLEGFLLKYPLR